MAFFNAGEEAVLLFFILSGFVLTIMLEKLVVLNYKNYLVRRGLRLYPVYYFALFFSISIHAIVHPYPRLELTDWFNTYSSGKIYFLYLVKSIVLVAGVGNVFDSVTWSLTYEMIISIIFPLFFLSIVKYKRICSDYIKVVKYLALVVAFMFILNNYLRIRYIDLIYYSHFFIIGIFLYKFREQLKVFVNNYFLICGCFLYFCRFFTYGVFKNAFLYKEICMLGASVIIVNAIYNQSFIKFLSMRVFKFYGKISYSFYLLHLPIMYCLVYVLYASIGFGLGVTKICSFIMSSFISVLSYKYIETPCIRLSKSR